MFNQGFRNVNFTQLQASKDWWGKKFNFSEPQT